MPRSPRPLVAGGTYHVTHRGNRDGEAIFRDGADRLTFLRLLVEIIEERGWRVLSWCLMTTHYHVLLETPEPDLAAGMHRLNGVYAKRFNRRHGVRGHLFADRYKSGLITREEHLFATFRYIALNPVAAQLTRSPRTWRWSGHAATLAGVDDGILDLPRIIDLFEGWGPDGRAIYAAFVEALLEAPGPPEPDTDPFILPIRPAIPDLVAIHGRDEAIRRAAEEHGYTVKQISDALGCSTGTVSNRVRR